MADKEKRMIEDYEVIHSIIFGSKELVIGEDLNNKDGMYYLIADCERNEFFERYINCLVGDDYEELMEIFAERLTDEVKKVRAEHDKITVPYAMKFYNADDCIPIRASDNLKNKIVVIKPEILRPEHRIGVNQLYLAAGGNGVYPNARGTAVFCTNLYDNSNTRFERHDVMGIAALKRIPDWAKHNYDKIIKNNKSKNDKER